MVATLNLPITKRENRQKYIDALIFSLYPVQLRRVLISISLPPSKKEAASSVILKIITISLNSFSSQESE